MPLPKAPSTEIELFNNQSYSGSIKMESSGTRSPCTEKFWPIPQSSCRVCEIHFKVYIWHLYILLRKGFFSKMLFCSMNHLPPIFGYFSCCSVNVWYLEMPTDFNFQNEGGILCSTVKFIIIVFSKVAFVPRYRIIFDRVLISC